MKITAKATDVNEIFVDVSVTSAANISVFASLFYSKKVQIQ